MANLQELFNDPDFLDLPESEQDSMVASMQTSSTKPVKPSLGEEIVKNVVPIYRPAKALAQGYNAVRESVTEPISHLMPEGGQEFPIKVPNPLLPTMPIKVGDYSGRESVKELAGLGFDQAVTGGLGKGIPALVKGGDKTLTSILRRVGGMGPDEIKNTRGLAREFGPDFVFSKTKAKPAYLEQEIAPKASELASGRVRSMEPDAMREIGIGSEDVQLAQELKSKFGFTEFPTESAAKDYFRQVINSAPKDSRIVPTKTLESLEKIIGRVDADEVAKLRSFLEVDPNAEQALFGTGKRVAELSPADYQNLRAYVNDLTENGKNSFFQQVKNALDEDASAVIPEITRAKGMFQLSQQVPKAEPYLDKVKLTEEIGNRLNTGSKQERATVRKSLGRLLGPQGETLIKDTTAQSLAKKWYEPAKSGSFNPRANMLLEAVRELARPIPRAYERSRATLIDVFAGRKPSVPQVSGTATSAYQKPVVQQTPKQTINYDELSRNAASYQTPEPKPTSMEAMAAAREDAIRRAVERGELPYGGSAGRYQGPEIPDEVVPMDPLQYAGGAGNYSGPEIPFVEPPINPLQYKGPEAKFDLPPDFVPERLPYNDQGVTYKAPGKMNLVDLVKKRKKK